MKKAEEFDKEQGHGNHNGCMYEKGKGKEFFCECLPRTLAEGELLWAAEENRLYGIGRKAPGLRLVTVLWVNESQKENELISFYPEHDGAETEVRLTAIHEWASGLEATLEGTVLGGEWEIAFFDTRHALNRGRYEIGGSYRFRLTAFAYHAEIVPEGEREIRFEGEEAVRQRERLGMDPETDGEGNPEPLIIRTDSMVAYSPQGAAYPDDWTFQSPVFGEPEELQAYGTGFLRLGIAVARDAEDVKVPLIAKKSLFGAVPKEGEPVRGTLWLQGYLSGGEEACDESGD